MGSVSSARVVSALPGRLRIRVARGPSAAGDLESVQRALDAVDEVTEVLVRSHATSLVVHFEARNDAAVTARLQGLGIAPWAPPANHAGDPVALTRGAADALNGAVVRRTPHDLRTLVPLGLGLLAARQAMRGPERLGDAPWYVLAWYASETFFKFNGQPQAPPAQRDEDN